MPFIQICNNVYLYKDCVNVYVIKNGNKAILIDFASGSILDHLSDIGVESVEYVFHTHHHRDQCHGDSKALKQNIKIGVPFQERNLFSKADEFWKTRAYKHLYLFKPGFFTSTYNIPVDLAFKNGDVFDWGPYQFKIINTKGHTKGSISYLLKIDNKTLAFTGDVIHSGGKLVNYYDLEYFYFMDQGAIGIRHIVRSLRKVMKHNPNMLLPSHGQIIREPKKDIDILKTRFKRASLSFNHINNIFQFYQQGIPTLISMAKSWFTKKSFPHIRYKLIGPTYIIFGNNNNCILMDFPGQIGNFKYNYKQLTKILKKNNIEKIDFVIPNHYHDDHIDGIPYLQQNHNVKVYATRNMVDILENPTHYRQACLIDKSIKVDRILEDGEILKWDDYEFQIFHFPGQTEYHMGMFGKIDGKSIFFTGDTVPVRTVGADARNNMMNWCRWGDDVGIVKCADILLKCNPEYVATSHFGIIKINKDILEKYKEEVSGWGPAIGDIVPQEDPNMGFDPNWICFKPIKVFSDPGKEFKTNLIVRNYLKKTSSVEFELNLPDGWEADVAKETYQVESETFAEFPISIKIPKTADPNDLTMITANIKWNGDDLGPIPDLMVDHGYSLDPTKEKAVMENISLFQWWVRAAKWIWRDFKFLK